MDYVCNISVFLELLNPVAKWVCPDVPDVGKNCETIVHDLDDHRVWARCGIQYNQIDDFARGRYSYYCDNKKNVLGKIKTT